MLSHHSAHSSASYNAFDTITEPGRRPQPMFMRRTKARRSKAAMFGALLCVILIIWGWRSSGIDIIPRTTRFSATSILSSMQTPINADLADAESPDGSSGHGSASSGVPSNRTAWHLLMPASESNPELCKTLLSAFVLGYPAPTLINWGKDLGGEALVDRSIIENSNGRTAKIRGVLNFLNDKSQVNDHDMVLIIDGYDVWFQLPLQIIRERYFRMIEEANARLKARYGMISEDEDADGVAERVPKYTQSVILGADKICWPNPKEDPACAAVPYSTLPKDIYGPDTDKDPNAFHNRPRFLNSGNVIGPAKDVRAMYAAAARKVEEQSRGGSGDQFVFAEIFGEQEFQRETARRAGQGKGGWGEWVEWLSDALGNSESPLSANITINNLTAVPGQLYEYGIGLDYESLLFQTMTHSIDDISYLTYNASSDFLVTHHSLPLFLPADLQGAAPPLSFASPGNRSADDRSGRGILLPYSAKLDDLPENDALSWRDLELATNTYSASVPALLHLNGDKSLLNTWWPRMWYHPYARALVRRFIRSTQTREAAASAARGGPTWWDRRGGRGGVWTDYKTWLNWGEVCKGHEEEVFADGKGVWGLEEGDGIRYNSFGKALTGEDE